MEYAKITIKPTSPFITSLQSDTIFGHFAWGVRFVFGEKRLQELLSEFEKKPFIIFSDGFEKGKLPKPFLKPYLPKDDELKFAKEIKKKAYIEKEFLFQNIDNLSDEKIFAYFKNRLKKKKNYTPCDIEKNIRYTKEEDKESETKYSITQKNSINRISNIVTEGLYSIKERFFIFESFEYEVYFAYQNIGKDEIKKVFEFIAKRGFGKDKSTGKGKFDFEIDWDFEEKKYFITKKNYYINLSTMFLSENMLLLYGKIITKFPKAGGYYASSEPYKNPCIMYLPGSTFVVKDEPLGKAESSVYNKESHYQNGFSIGIYFNGEVT